MGDCPHPPLSGPVHYCVRGRWCLDGTAIIAHDRGMGTPPCHRSKNTAFHNPASAQPRSVRAAVVICEACPIRRECARDALTSGTSLDGSYTRPANDVIQAGVICRGDQGTAIRLAAIAGVTELPEYVEQEARAVAPDECRHCHRPMVKWTRDRVPEGYVAHHARGFCQGCRKAYSEFMRSQPKRQRGLRKPVDRKRHHAVSARRGRRELVVQLPLF